jgi:hypothetical protein
MAIDQTDIVDFATIDDASGDLRLTISDHLSWEDEGHHLILLQNKLNAYLRFVESGEMFEKASDAKGRGVVINVVGKFPLSKKAEVFFAKNRAAIEDAGFRLQFRLWRRDAVDLGKLPPQ